MPGLISLRSASSSNSSSTAAAPAHIPDAYPHRHALPPRPSAPTGPLPVASHALPAFPSVANPPFLSRAPAMSVVQPIHCRQIADPLTDMSRARFQDIATMNYSSSGSPHDPSTVCLAAMVHEFLEEEARVGCGRARCNCVDGVCTSNGGDDGEEVANEPEESQLQDEHLCEILEGITSCTTKPELLLVVDVARAVEAESEELFTSTGSQHDEQLHADRLRRPVMKRLREQGYNAAICKSRWKHADGLPAGDYEYIDIVMDASMSSKAALMPGGSTTTTKKQVDRFIVDIDFKAQFEIARASKQYVQLLGVLPKLFVGKAERLKQILKIMSNAAKCSLKEQGLLLPPWRKHKYVQAKWLSPYRRTTNSEPLSSTAPLPTSVAQSGRPVQQEVLAGLELRAPATINLSLDFTKEMDLLFYKAQVRALRIAHKQQHHTSHAYATKAGKGDHVLTTTASSDPMVGDVLQTRGFLSNVAVEKLDASAITGTVSHWQLPASQHDKCNSGTRSDHYKVSGLSTALRQANSLLPSQPVASRSAMVS